ncbi:hypothetical protein PR001_g17544 [Phytophthora rubi]|uniref:Tc1-like transposase DDE domain-containing protein n=1 Tax=Phytophthora rubi TaxID=129364 RepID=A0A6A3KN63_9STRA|nr:hypothetical protein PR001_g17544 [Phytophthora rubi]
MEEVATRQHAHPNTVYHCLYAYYQLGYSKQHLAHIFNKSERTLSNWIKTYEETGAFQRAKSASERTFTAEQRAWLLHYYEEHLLAYLDEVQDAFTKVHRITMSKTSVWRIIHEGGLSWKVLERRAMHIKERDVFRFVEEISHIDWSHQNIVFLDEVSFDNRGMLRRRGYALRGKKVAIRGDFERPRVSILAFIGVNGIIDYFNTEGTFDRVEFTKCCQDFVHSSGFVRQYPGPNSVWILDGAAIHRHPEIVHYLRSVGIVPIFLPAYCPFFNPIEFLFGYVKRSFQRHYAESSGRDLTPFVVKTFQRFKGFNMANVFEHCGWRVQGFFDPTGLLASERRQESELNQDRRIQDEFDFTEIAPPS